MKQIAIILTMLVSLSVSAKPKQEIRPEVWGSKKLKPYTYQYDAGLYFWDDRSGDMNRIYKYGKMTDEEYNQLILDMLVYHKIYEFKTITYAMHQINKSSYKSVSNWDYDGNDEIDATSSAYNHKDIRVGKRLSIENYVNKKYPGYGSPGIAKNAYHGGTSGQGYYSRWDKDLGVWMDRPHGFYHDDTIDYNYLPEIKEGNNRYSIGTDYSIEHGNLFPANFRVWFDVKHDDTLTGLGVVDNDAIKVYNPEGVFIYVYDFDEYRKASSDWALHDRILFGMEDDYEDDIKSPYEERYGVKGLPRMCKFTYGPIINEANSDALIASRVFIHLRTELAKEYLVANLHPAPDMDFSIWDYKYSPRKDNLKESVIYPGLSQYCDVNKYTKEQSIDMFMKRVDVMNIYDYWAGVYKSMDMVREELKKHHNAMTAYIKTGSKAELKKAQIAARRFHMLEAFRGVYSEKAMSPAGSLAKAEDLGAYFSNDRLSIALWAGTTGAGAWKHRSDQSLKTAIPYFEGKGKPGLMGYIDGYKEEMVWRVLNMGGMIDIYCMWWGVPWNHKHVKNFKFLGVAPLTGDAWFEYDVDYPGDKEKNFKRYYEKRRLQPSPAVIPDPFIDKKFYFMSDRDNLYDKKSTLHKVVKAPEKRWKFVNSKPGLTVEKVPRGVITNTGGLVFGGYIGKQSDIAELKAHYGNMKNAWNAALKGPYMIVSSETYKKLGHEYFEKQAGKKLFKADVTGAMIEASARTIVQVLPNDSRFKDLMKSEYFYTGQDNAKAPTISYNYFSGSYKKKEVNMRYSRSWKNEDAIVKDVEEALAKDEKQFPGCSVLAAGYIMNPDDTKGLMFLQRLYIETSEKERLWLQNQTPWPDTIKELQLDTITKEYPSFIANPNLLLAYYKNIGRIRELVKKHIAVAGDGKYHYWLDFTEPGTNTNFQDSMDAMYSHVYHGVYGDYAVDTLTSGQENTRIESVMMRFLDNSWEKAYLKTRYERKVNMKSHNGAQQIANLSQGRIMEIPEDKRKHYNYYLRNPRSSHRSDKNYDYYLNDLTNGVGVYAPRMRNRSDENLYLQNLGYQERLEYGRADLECVYKIQKLFPGFVRIRDTRRIYDYTNYSVQKPLRTKFWINRCAPTLVSALYASDYEPSIISETYLRMNWDRHK